jgi:hypothetical protein
MMTWVRGVLVSVCLPRGVLQSKMPWVAVLALVGHSSERIDKQSDQTLLKSSAGLFIRRMAANNQ